MDIYPIHQDPIELTKVGGINRRRLLSEDASKGVSAAWGLPVKQSSARRVSVDESPEKWLITNKLWSERDLVQQDHNETVAWTALRLLIDALGYKCGHRTVEWSPSDHRDWKNRQKDNGGTRNQCIHQNQELKNQTSLGSAEIASLLNASDRNRMNEHAHCMRIPALAVALKSLIRQYPPGTTSVSKVFQHVVGCPLETAITGSAFADKRLTTKGVESVPENPFKIDPVETEQRGIW